jgi:acetyltransferase-like isoleucine patch superfamily enzyme
MNRFIVICRLLFHLLPETRCFGIKRSLLRLAGAHIGINVRICSSTRIFGSGNLTIGNNTWIGHETMLAVFDDITIGDNVNIAPRCYIGTGSHFIDPNGDSIAGQGKQLPIMINDGAWLCVGSIVLPGTVIKKKAIIAAGSVVSGVVKEYELVGSGLAYHIKFLNQ